MVRVDSDFSKDIEVIANTPEIWPEQARTILQCTRNSCLCRRTVYVSNKRIGQLCMLRAYALDVCLHRAVSCGKGKNQSVEEVCFVLLADPTVLV